jgi:hypothetical protein
MPTHDPRVEYTVKELLLKIDDRIDSFEKAFTDHVKEDSKRFGRLDRFAAIGTSFASVALAIASAYAYSVFNH